MNPIALLAGLLGGKLWLAWLIVAGLGLGAVGGLYVAVDHGGYKRAAAEWTIKYEKREAALNEERFKELDRQATANDAAKAAEAERLAAEQSRVAELELQIAEMDKAADVDVNRDRIGLGADSVDRLKRIR